MFNPGEFLKREFLKNVGKISDVYIADRASFWFEKGVLTADDLTEIQTAIDAQHTTEVLIEEDLPVEGE